MNDESKPAMVSNHGDQRIEWDDSAMRSVYSNVCNVASTREEVFLLFGTHQHWHTSGGPVKVKLTDRMVLSPFAAKRLSMLLGNLIREYENKYGVLQIGQ
jgi:hypothetical protein